MPKFIKVAHSPDSDDAFMFYAIKEHKIYIGDLVFEFHSDEIEKLNQNLLTQKDDFDICAASFHTAFLVKERYQILDSGASMAGSDYGPRIIYKDKTEGLIAIPGEFTSANLAWQAFANENKIEYQPVYCSYDEVFDLISEDKVSMSLLIHESQLKYKDLGFNLLVDLGQWWYRKYNGLQLPLGANLIRSSLGEETINDIQNLLSESIQWGLANIEETLAYASNFANHGLDPENANKYISMYVNESTVKLSKEDKESIKILSGFVKNQK